MNLRSLISRSVVGRLLRTLQSAKAPVGHRTPQVLSRRTNLPPPDVSGLVAQWDAYNAAYLRELSGLVWILFADPDTEPGAEKRRISVLHFGCGSGGLFRALETNLGHLFDFEFHGVDPDIQALVFLKAKLPSAEIYDADLAEFAEMQKTSPIKADVAVAALHCYAEGEDYVQLLMRAFSAAASRVVIADQIDNVDGAAMAKLKLRDHSGRKYDADCHAFATLLGQAGYDDTQAFKTATPSKSVTGFIVSAKNGGLDPLHRSAPLQEATNLQDVLPSPGASESRGPLIGATLKAHLALSKLSGMDVGAAGGLHPLWQPHGDVMEIDAFEPDAKACAAAQANSTSNVHWHPVALAQQTGPQDFYVLNAPTGSSFYPPNDDVQRFLNNSHYRGIDKVVVIETLSISDFLERSGRPVPNLIKLDTQGSELDILRSLQPDQWEDVLAIETEVEFIEVYKEQPLFCDLDAFLRSKGMLLFDLRTAREYCCDHDTVAYYMKEHLNFELGDNHMSARLYAGDALYFHDFCSAPLRSKNYVMKMLATLLIYSYFDYALFLCERAAEAGVISRDARDALFQEILAAAPKPKPWQRADEIGATARSRRGADDWADYIYSAFWQVRSWPNQ